MKKLRTAFKEISNYFFILNTIDKNVKTEAWLTHQLRVDIIGRIYTVISLREEDMGEMEDVKRFKVLERMRPVNEYLTGLGLQEVLIPNISEVENSRSWLVTYTPVFNQFSYIWLSLNIVFPLGLLMQLLLF